jgi:molecular chaperone HtpG
MKEKIKKFDAEVSKILNLVINSVYTNKEIFLRELISNSSDACDKLRYESISNKKLIDKSHKYYISLQIDAKNSTMTIVDTGIGMNKEDLINNIGTIAKSGTERFFFKLIKR